MAADGLLVLIQFFEKYKPPLAGGKNICANTPQSGGTLRKTLLSTRMFT